MGKLRTKNVHVKSHTRHLPSGGTTRVEAHTRKQKVRVGGSTGSSPSSSKDWFTGEKIGSVGYDVDDSTSKRRKALKRMIGELQEEKDMSKGEAAMKTWQKLHGLYVTWENQSGYSEDDVKAVRRDRDWVDENYDMER